jgi:hypothetical protein
MLSDDRGRDEGTVGFQGVRAPELHRAAVDAFERRDEHHHIGLLAEVKRLLDGDRAIEA